MNLHPDYRGWEDDGSDEYNNITVGEDALDMMFQVKSIQKQLANIDKYDGDLEIYNEFRFRLAKEDFNRLIPPYQVERIKLAPKVKFIVTDGVKNPGETEFDNLIITRNVFSNGLLNLEQLIPFIHADYVVRTVGIKDLK